MTELGDLARDGEVIVGQLDLRAVAARFNRLELVAPHPAAKAASCRHRCRHAASPEMAYGRWSILISLANP